MSYPIKPYWVKALVLILVCLITRKVFSQNDTREEINNHLETTIAEVKVGATPNARHDAAMRLANQTKVVDPKMIDDKTINDIMHLLDLPEARYWSAAALANIGPRARMAIPTLEKWMAVEDCSSVSMSASGPIRRALNNMGVKTPPYPAPCRGSTELHEK